MPPARAAMITLVALALFAALAIVGRETAEVASDNVTSVGSRDSVEASGSLLGALAEKCTPESEFTGLLDLGGFAPIDNGRIAAEPEAPLSPPTHLSIPDIGVDARVIAVALDTRRQVIVPVDISAVGWYEFGPAPGSDSGSCVLVAHRDGPGGACGAFVDLGKLVPGDAINVTLADGTDLAYEVRAREMVLKSWFAQQSGDFFTDIGSPRLTLITCGGDYDQSKGGYQSNIIVTARPSR